MANNSALFGPAGTGQSFAALGFKKTAQLPDYLTEFGLTAFEYQCGQGVRINEKSASALGSDFAAKGIAVSLHAPYFISLSGVEEEKRRNSIGYILKSAEAVKIMGGNRIVVHSGSCSKMSREQALSLAVSTIKLAREAMMSEGYENIRCCLETMGKINQLGTLDEVLELCAVDESFLPCIDFGHLNARTFGGIKTKADYAEILDRMENKLGSERVKSFHSHFSKIEYSSKGGEVRHLTFADSTYGPDYEPLMELIAERYLSPTFICESAGTQTEDAKAMKDCYCDILA